MYSSSLRIFLLKSLPRQNNGYFFFAILVIVATNHPQDIQPTSFQLNFRSHRFQKHIAKTYKQHEVKAKKAKIAVLFYGKCTI